MYQELRSFTAGFFRRCIATAGRPYQATRENEVTLAASRRHRLLGAKASGFGLEDTRWKGDRERKRRVKEAVRPRACESASGLGSLCF